MIEARLSDGLTEYTCDLHTLQLGILDTFKSVPEMKSVLSKSKEIAKFTHKSPDALKELKAESTRQNINFLKLANPIDTRWNSAHDNLSYVLHIKATFEKLSDSLPHWEEKAFDQNQIQ